MTTRYGVPIKTTPEALATRFSCVIEYGDYVIMAGHYWMGGYGNPNYYAAIYEYMDYEYLEDGIGHDCESEMELIRLTDVEFKDAGHAIKWAIEKIDEIENDESNYRTGYFRPEE